MFTKTVVIWIHVDETMEQSTITSSICSIMIKEPFLQHYRMDRLFTLILSCIFHDSILRDISDEQVEPKGLPYHH